MDLSRSTKSFWSWVERALFLAGLLLLIHPILSSAYYFTIDGPSHVYTASLLLDHLKSGASAGPYEINPLPVPNWSGHALLALLQVFMSPISAMKLLHLLCMAALPIALRMWATQRSKGIPWATHLVLPFMVPVTFTMGFYNFCLALSLVVWVMWSWERASGPNVGPWAWVRLSALLALLYFTHLLPFTIAVLWLGIQAIVPIVLDLVRFRRIERDLLRRSWPLVLCVMPGLILLTWYLVANPEGTTPNTADVDRSSMIWNAFAPTGNLVEVVLWAAAVMCMLLVVALHFSRTEKPSNSVPRNIPRTWSDATFLVVLLLLLMFVPNGVGVGSEVVKRLAILAHVWVLTMLPFSAIQRWAGVWLSITVMCIVLGQDTMRRDDRERHTAQLRRCTQLLAALPEGSEVATIHYGWWNMHMFALGAAESQLRLMYNYELDRHHFPLRWNAAHLQSMRDQASDPLDALHEHCFLPGAMLRQAEYILVVGVPTTENEQHLAQLLLSELAGTFAPGPSDQGCWILQRK